MEKIGYYCNMKWTKIKNVFLLFVTLSSLKVVAQKSENDFLNEFNKHHSSLYININKTGLSNYLKQYTLEVVETKDSIFRYHDRTLNDSLKEIKTSIKIITVVPKDIYNHKISIVFNNSDSTVLKIGLMKEGVLQGFQYTYTFSGKILMSEMYLDGLKNGYFFQYRTSGKSDVIDHDSFWKNGKIQFQRHYYRDSKIQTITSFDNDVITSIVTFTKKGEIQSIIDLSVFPKQRIIFKKGAIVDVVIE